MVDTRATTREWLGMDEPEREPEREYVPCAGCGLRNYETTNPTWNCPDFPKCAEPLTIDECEVDVMHCPKCDAEYADFDGFGVLYCEGCGWCSHASVDGNVCGLCKATLQ